MEDLVEAGPVIGKAAASGNFKVLKTMLGPAFRGLIEKRGKATGRSLMDLGYQANFDWTYKREFPEMARLYEAAKVSQWNASKDIDWSREVDIFDPARPLIPDSYLPVAGLAGYGALSEKEKCVQRHGILSWMLSQFLHGEQGALFASAQVTEACPWMDGKLYGGTQVVDEARHVEVFHRYLTGKLEKLYEINDNLYVIIDALMTDSRWDVKFLGMQIMVEGLALAAFGTIRQATGDPLLKEVLKYVVTDEGRHVHYGVLALENLYTKEFTEKERREREDWAFEVALLMRDRFLAHEFYDEFYAHKMSRRAWDKLVLGSELMGMFRTSMFKRLVPNLKRIGLLTDRVRSKYERLGILKYESGKNATELTTEELLEDR
ncbi:MAG: ferritin-like domain-containing protein [Candidatus Methylomirabilis sp.]|nr:ferritin-like domain-containing protein [Deltaproteobacteria bacterium]